MQYIELDQMPCQFGVQLIQPSYFRPWDSVPCLNTAVGAKVKLLKPAEVRVVLWLNWILMFSPQNIFIFVLEYLLLGYNYLGESSLV